MTPQEINRAVYERLHEATDSRDLERISRTVDEVFHPDAVFHATGPVGPTARDAVKGAWAMLLRAFPDIRVTVEDTIAEGDKIVVRNTVRGTHQGEYRGLAPTGRTVTYGEIFVVRFSEGKVAEAWGVVDIFSQMQQLGERVP
ncbi:ester cyclase [Nocardiopsis sp. RSe5-2]|uniref:Ester cyclase n=1 Tax=Nocardiopsis endophytica TaxID=3018445 RepID=A0ABT4U6C9_9ACTN|nr:ester cyclase [Nocardiopsis endophytica]MDA2811917.1 ester cyclase [Nocardiopsis endophytica]